MILVSACLVGLNCKYNGGNNYNEEIFDLVKTGKAIPICPEQLGGLTTPRAPAEIKIIDGKRRVINNKGIDVTEEFEKGAEEVLKLVVLVNRIYFIIRAIFSLLTWFICRECVIRGIESFRYLAIILIALIIITYIIANKVNKKVFGDSI